MVGRSLSAIVPAERSGELPEILEGLRNGKLIERYETERVRKDGSHVLVSLTVSPVKDPHGRLIGASTIARDISQRKREEDERLALSQELTAALAQANHIKEISA
jgi:PAS domain S-box-containing protein